MFFSLFVSFFLFILFFSRIKVNEIEWNSIFFTPLLPLFALKSCVFFPSFAFLCEHILLVVAFRCEYCYFAFFPPLPPLPFVCVFHLINIVGCLCSFRLLLAVIVVRFFVFFSCRSFHIPAFSLALHRCYTK